MYIVIIGGGKSGAILAEELAKGKHDVAIVEKDAAIAESLAQQVNAKVIHGNALEREALEDAGVPNADAVVIALEEEGLNLLIAMLSKEMGATKVIVTSKEVEYEQYFRKVGVDKVISQEHSLASQVNAILTQPDIYDLVVLHQDVDLYEYGVGKNSPIVGKEYEESLTPKDTLIVAVRRDGEFMIPNSETVFKEGDTVIVIAKKDAESAVRKVLKA